MRAEKNMRIEVLGHASMLISTNEASVIIDPWLVGSAYWRSWWNYPKASYDEERLRAVDAVVISHIHWDHWHGASIKKYFRGKRFIVPDEPSLRSERDLRSIGIADVVRLRNGDTFQMNDLQIRLYQFGLYLNDAAVVIANDKYKVLNANDAKIAGASLTSLLSREGRIDLAFRSHSTANARACYKIRGSHRVFDDNEHYLRSFKLFMDRVKPRYAIPFASNHCHLHPDTLHFNKVISNPSVLQNYLAQHDKEWSYEVMLPGSVWDGSEGFTHKYTNDVFVNLDEKLSDYKKDVEALLCEQSVREDRVIISDGLINRFVKMLPNLKKIGNKHRRDLSITLTFPTKASMNYTLKILQSGHAALTLEHGKQVCGPEIIIPALVFRDSILKNMFHHAAISKRVRFIGDDERDLKFISAFYSTLEKRELIGLDGCDGAYLARSFRAYTRRLSEVLVYVKAFFLLKILRLPIYEVEELVLKGKWFGASNVRSVIRER